MTYDLIERLREDAMAARRHGDEQTRAAEGNDRLTRTMRQNAEAAYAKADAIERAIEKLQG